MIFVLLHHFGPREFFLLPILIKDFLVVSSVSWYIVTESKRREGEEGRGKEREGGGERAQTDPNPRVKEKGGCALADHSPSNFSRSRS